MIIIIFTLLFLFSPSGNAFRGTCFARRSRRSSRAGTFASSVSERDTEIITNFLGYRPTNIVNVSARDPQGNPTVVTLYPLLRSRVGNYRAGAGISVDKYEPFPTLYWLVCPKLKKRVAKLEYLGYVAAFEAQLERDNIARVEMTRAHHGKLQWTFSLPLKNNSNNKMFVSTLKRIRARTMESLKRTR